MVTELQEFKFAYFPNRALASRGTMLPYDKVRIFIDEEYSIAEKFTVSICFCFISISIL